MGTQISDMTVTATPLPAGAFVPVVVTSPATGLSTLISYRYDLGTDLLTRVSYTALSATGGSALAGYIAAGTGATATTAQAQLRKARYVTDYSTIAQAITAAGTNGTVIFPEGAYTADTLTILAGQTWIMQGARITTASTTASVIVASGVDNWAIQGSCRLIGPRVSQTSGTARGVSITNCVRFRVEGVTAQNIVGSGFYVEGSETPAHGEAGQFSNCAAFACVIGRSCAASPKGEYTTWTNFNAVGNDIGIQDSAGNTNTTNGNITDNRVGINLATGANGNHGIFAAMNINHNTDYNLEIYRVANGHSFIGCHIYDGDFFFTDCQGINIDGGILSIDDVYNRGARYTASIATTTMTVTAIATPSSALAAGQPVIGPGVTVNTVIVAQLTGSAGSTGTYSVSISQTVSSAALSSAGWNFVRNMFCPGPDTTIHTEEASYAPFISFQNCYGHGAYKNGVSINDPAQVYVHARRLRGAGTQTVAPSDVLIFPDVQANGNRSLGYAVASGITTIPSGGAGQYRVEAGLSFTVTDSTVIGSTVQLSINGTAVEDYAPTIKSTTGLRFVLTRELYLSDGDTVKVVSQVNGTTPAFGSAASDSYISITRIA